MVVVLRYVAKAFAAVRAATPECTPARASLRFCHVYTHALWWTFPAIQAWKVFQGEALTAGPQIAWAISDFAAKALWAGSLVASHLSIVASRRTRAAVGAAGARVMASLRHDLAAATTEGAIAAAAASALARMAPRAVARGVVIGGAAPCGGALDDNEASPASAAALCGCAWRPGGVTLVQGGAAACAAWRRVEAALSDPSDTSTSAAFLRSTCRPTACSDHDRCADENAFSDFAASSRFAKKHGETQPPPQPQQPQLPLQKRWGAAAAAAVGREAPHVGRRVCVTVSLGPEEALTTHLMMPRQHRRAHAPPRHCHRRCWAS